MPEDELETSEIRDQLEESNRRAEESEARAGWIIYLSFSTAVIAVLAAIASLESGAYSNDALLLKNEALLAQTKASDQWAYYQAKSVKGTIYSSQAAQLLTSNAELGQKEAERYGREEAEISKTANELEKKVAEDSERSSESMEHHHRFAYAVTMFQISIALAAIAALSRQRAVWLGGLLVAVVGLVYFVDGFRLFF